MNKLLKGAVAGAAGVALLLGGAGTFALWNDSASVDVGTINSGELNIASVAAGSWSQDLDYIVPGDVLTYTESFTVEATGDNLNAQLTSNINDLVDDSGIDGVVTTVDFDVTDAAAAAVAPTAGVYGFGEGTFTVDVAITVTFPSTVTGQTGQNQSLDLTAVAITLSQV